jgi:hypothetical protein
MACIVLQISMPLNTELQKHWDNILAAEGLAPINVVSVALRSQVISDEAQERLFRLAELLETGEPGGPSYLTAEQSTYWQEHWEQRDLNAELAIHLAKGGFARKWQRRKCVGSLKSVHRRVGVLRKLAGFVRLEAGQEPGATSSLQTEILDEFAKHARFFASGKKRKGRRS